jgi:hypothetical protein
MHKTTVYLPEELKRTLAHVARAKGRSEAELIREAVRLITEPHVCPEPVLPLFESGAPGLSEDVDEALAGFGEH